MATFQESKARYEDVLRKAQEARDAEKKREAEAKARQVDWNGRASNAIQNMTNAATKILGELPVRIDDAREGRGFIVLLRTLDDKKHAELKVTFTDDYSRKLMECKLAVGPDSGEFAIDLPEMPASPQPAFDRAKRDMETTLSGLLVKFFDRIVTASTATAPIGIAPPAAAAPAAIAPPAATPPLATPPVTAAAPTAPPVAPSSPPASMPPASLPPLGASPLGPRPPLGPPPPLGPRPFPPGK